MKAAAGEVVIYGSGKGDGTLMMPVTAGEGENKTLYMVPVPPAGADDYLLALFSHRATASVQGHCRVCGARRHISARRGHTSQSAFNHADWCPVIDDNMIAAIRRWRATGASGTDAETIALLSKIIDPA